MWEFRPCAIDTACESRTAASPPLLFSFYLRRPYIYEARAFVLSRRYTVGVIVLQLAEGITEYENLWKGRGKAT